MNKGIADEALGAFRRIKEIIERHASSVGWEWDSRFGTVLLVLKEPEHQIVAPTAASVLPRRWDRINIRNAPEPVAKLSRQLGGVRDSQVLWTLEPTAELLAYAAWWPWADGKTHSLRLGWVANAEAAREADVSLLRRLFGV